MISKLEKFQSPKNLTPLGVEICNEEIWCETLQPHTTSKYVKV